MQERHTIQQRIIGEALCGLGDHPTADRVYVRIHDDYPSISKATVYRVLNRMAETGAALRVRIPDGADHFDHNAAPHLHIRCSACGRVDDVLSAPTQDLRAAVRDACGYRITGVDIQFFGLCPACAEEGRENGSERVL